MDPSRQAFKGVLDYLRDAEERCRLAHRPELAREYHRAWETAADAIYGPLSPSSPPTVGAMYAPVTPKPKVLTHDQQRALVSPYRKIIAIVDDHEVLECGHRHWIPIQLTDAPATRRRCRECGDQKTAAQVTKSKPPASARSAAARKDVSA